MKSKATVLAIWCLLMNGILTPSWANGAILVSGQNISVGSHSSTEISTLTGSCGLIIHDPMNSSQGSLHSGMWLLPALGISNTGYEDGSFGGLPTCHHLYQNSPNPFNPKTCISFDQGAVGRTVITVYDVAGRLVDTILDKEMPRGHHSVYFDGSSYSSGVFFFRLETTDFVQTRKMTLIK